MAKSWQDIPIFRENITTTGSFNIETHLEELYEKKKTEYEEIFKPEFLENRLVALQQNLSRFKALYLRIAVHLFNSFLEDLEKGNSESTLAIELYGPDTHYSSEERFYLEKAVENFCQELTQRKYPWRVYENQRKVNDFMAGTCIVGTRYLHVTLK